MTTQHSSTSAATDKHYPRSEAHARVQEIALVARAGQASRASAPAEATAAA